MNIELIKTVDALLGRLTTYILTQKRFEQNVSTIAINKILFIRPGGLGDAILLLPAIKSIKQIFKNAEIDILAENRNYKAFNFINEINKIYRYDNAHEFINLLLNKYDLVIDTEQWHRLTSIVARMVGKITVGFDTNERRKNFDIAVKYSHNRYEINSFMDLADTVTSMFNKKIKTKIKTPFININTTFKLDVAIFTGASNILRKWSIEKYRKLAAKLLEKNFVVALIGGKDDIEFNKKIAHNLSIFDFTGKTSLTKTAEIIKGSRTLFTTDSGILHLGAALDVATISLFGPGIEAKWAPKGNKHIVINKHLPCSPCTRFGYTPECRIDAKCIKDIEVEEVYDNIIKAMEIIYD